VKNRVFYETSFDSKQPILVSKYPKQDVCLGCFASISKQRVLVFRLTQNKKN
jgi:hypothetical protein